MTVECNLHDVMAKNLSQTKGIVACGIDVINVLVCGAAIFLYAPYVSVSCSLQCSAVKTVFNDYAVHVCLLF